MRFEIDINKSIIEKIALEATTKGYTVTGVQKIIVTFVL